MKIVAVQRFSWKPGQAQFIEISWSVALWSGFAAKAIMTAAVNNTERKTNNSYLEIFVHIGSGLPVASAGGNEHCI